MHGQEQSKHLHTRLSISIEHFRDSVERHEAVDMVDPKVR